MHEKQKQEECDKLQDALNKLINEAGSATAQQVNASLACTSINPLYYELSFLDFVISMSLSSIFWTRSSK